MNKHTGSCLMITYVDLRWMQSASFTFFITNDKILKVCVSFRGQLAHRLTFSGLTAVHREILFIHSIIFISFSLNMALMNAILLSMSYIQNI